MILKDEGSDISLVNGRGPKGEIFLICTVVRKRNVKRIVEIVNMLEPNAFITIENVISHKKGFISSTRIIPLFGRNIAKKE